jgi:hypothetical protein
MVEPYDVLGNDAVIHVYGLEGFLRNHREELKEKDAANLEIAVRILKRYTPPKWLAQYDNPTQAFGPVVVRQRRRRPTKEKDAQVLRRASEISKSRRTRSTGR